MSLSVPLEPPSDRYSATLTLYCHSNTVMQLAHWACARMPRSTSCCSCSSFFSSSDILSFKRLWIVFTSDGKGIEHGAVFELGQAQPRHRYGVIATLFRHSHHRQTRFGLIDWIGFFFYLSSWWIFFLVWYTDMEGEIAALKALFKQQLDQSAARERRLTELFYSTAKSLTTVTSTSSSPALKSNLAHVHKPVAVDRPILLSLSTLADFLHGRNLGRTTPCASISIFRIERRRSALFVRPSTKTSDATCGNSSSLCHRLQTFRKLSPKSRSTLGCQVLGCSNPASLFNFGCLWWFLNASRNFRYRQAWALSITDIVLQ